MDTLTCVINIEKLIRCVKARPALYDLNTKEYYDRVLKRGIWEDVCSDLNRDFRNYDEKDKTLFWKEVQKKWHSLRDCFRREVQYQSNPPTDKRPKTKYRYYDALQFLLPFTNRTLNEARDGGHNNEPELPDQQYSAEVCLKRKNSTPIEEDIISDDDLPKTYIKKKSEKESDEDDWRETTLRLKRKKKPSIEEDPLENAIKLQGNKMTYIEVEPNPIPEEVFQERVAIEGQGRYMDEDEAFLMSLLSSFKQYTLDQKYELRIEIMQTILKFKKKVAAQNDLRDGFDEDSDE